MPYSSSSKLTACWGLLRDLDFFRAAKSSQEVGGTISKSVFGEGVTHLPFMKTLIFSEFLVFEHKYSVLSLEFQGDSEA